jgi:hypothetical protein
MQKVRKARWGKYIIYIYIWIWKYQIERWNCEEMTWRLAYLFNPNSNPTVVSWILTKHDKTLSKITRNFKWMQMARKTRKTGHPWKQLPRFPRFPDIASWTNVVHCLVSCTGAGQRYMSQL